MKKIKFNQSLDLFENLEYGRFEGFCYDDLFCDLYEEIDQELEYQVFGLPWKNL